MSEAVLLNAKFYAGQYDFSGYMNALAIDMSAETPEKTAMGDTNKTRLPGLKDTGFSLNGHFDAINPDKFLFDNMSLSDIPMTMAVTGADETACFLFQPNISAYSPGGKVGDVMAFSVKGQGNGALIKGTILFPKTTKTASDTGTIMELGAVGAAQKLYGLLHVFAGSAGDTLDVIIQSDALVGFGSPTTVLTFTQIAGVPGYEFKTADGPITDTFYRVSFTIAGTDESFLFAVAMGIF